MFGRGKNKKPDAPAPSQEAIAATNRLKDLCGTDVVMYTALSRLMLLDPGKINSSTEAILGDAQDNETKGNTLKAEIEYRVAGSLSLWKADTDGVKKYFAKASSLANPAHTEYAFISQRADEAVSIAKRFYESTTATTQKTSTPIPESPPQT